MEPRSLEELMSLFGGLDAPAVYGRSASDRGFAPPGGGFGRPVADEDPRRRARGYGGVGGPETTLARLLPFLMGLRGHNVAGPQGQMPQGPGGANAAPGSQQGFSNNQPAYTGQGYQTGGPVVNAPVTGGRTPGPQAQALPMEGAGGAPDYSQMRTPSGLISLLRVGR